MKFAFQKMRLEADSLYALVSTWAEMQLQLTEDGAVITGYGFAHEIAEAFTNLVLDWEASIFFPEGNLSLESGTYELIFIKEKLYACRDQEKLLLEDTPVVVQVTSAPE